MIRLDTTTRTLELKLNAPVASAQLPITVSYSDKTSTTYNGATQLVNSNNTTVVTICSAPGPSVVRDIDYVSVFNADTAPVSLTIQINDNSVVYTEIFTILSAKDKLEYIHGSGWRTTDTQGNFKTVGQTGATGATGLQGPVGPAVFLVAENGEDGFDGAPGVQGAPGIPGSPGVQGLPGVTVFTEGIDGEDGNPGPPGATGVQGIQGIQGIQGLIGRDGIPGFDGEAGQDGFDGVPGPRGLTGATGSIGQQGFSFIAALDGQDGEDGLTIPAQSSSSSTTVFASNVEYTTGIEPAKALSPLVARTNNLVLRTAVATTSGTFIDFTGIPSWVKCIRIQITGNSTNGTSVPIIQLGISTGVETTGYSGTGFNSSGSAVTNNATQASGFNLEYGGIAAVDTRNATFVLTLQSGNTWVSNLVCNGINTARSNISVSTKTLAGTLDRVRLTTVNGIDTFDAGSINIMYE